LVIMEKRLQVIDIWSNHEVWGRKPYTEPIGYG
jgi:hypothetical protein